jgi:hypothetical protein
LYFAERQRMSVVLPHVPILRFLSDYVLAACHFSAAFGKFDLEESLAPERIGNDAP